MDALRAMLAEATDAEMRSEMLRALLQPSVADAQASLAADLPCLQVGLLSARPMDCVWLLAAMQILCTPRPRF